MRGPRLGFTPNQRPKVFPGSGLNEDETKMRTKLRRPNLEDGRGVGRDDLGLRKLYYNLEDRYSQEKARYRTFVD